MSVSWTAWKRISLCLAPEQIYVTAEEFSASLDRFPRLEIEELSVADPESSSIYLSSQSTRKYHGNIRELIGDLNKFRESGRKNRLSFSPTWAAPNA